MLGSVKDVLKLWPSFEEVARDFQSAGVPVSNWMVSKWARRGRIGPEYWEALVRFAEARGLRGVTFELLAALHAKSASERPALREARA